MESPLINGTSLLEEIKEASVVSEVKSKTEVTHAITKSSNSFAELRTGFSVSNYVFS